jgi:hypothetical protein
MSEKFLEFPSDMPRTPEAVRLASPEEIKGYFNFADPILGVDWGEKGVPEEYTPEYVASHPEATQVFVIRGEGAEIAGGSKVTMLDAENQARLGLDAGLYARQKGVLLEYTAIREPDRNKKLLAELTSKRLEWAREHGAGFAATEIELTNPVSAHTKTRDGFVFVGVKDPIDGIPHPYLVAVLPLGEKGPVSQGGETKEVEVDENSKEYLATLFAEGWIGIDAKCDSDAGPWKLLMEKRQ